MYFANPWGLLGLLALPAIVAIHLFRRRFPPLYVAGAHLWGAETRVADAGRTRDRLPVTPSLLLELLAALLLTLALSDPRLNETEAVIHLVAVLDDSASMQAIPGDPRADDVTTARPAPGASFRDQAIDVLKNRMARAGRDARLTLIRSGQHPTLLGERGMTWPEAEQALADWNPSAASHDVHPTWDEAVQLVGRDGRFLFLTDTMPGDALLPAGIEVVALGRALGNVGFSASRWTLEPQGKQRLFLRVANLGEADQQVKLVATSAGRSVLEQSLTVPARSELPFEQELPAGLGELDVTLTSENDPLAADNRLQLIEPQPRTVRIAVTLSPQSRAFRLTERVLAALPDLQLTDPDAADLVIGDAAAIPTTSPTRDAAWWLGIGPVNHSDAFRKQAVNFAGPWLIERQHPLMEGVTLGGVVWGGVQPHELDLAPLISVDTTPLFGQAQGINTTAWLMNIDLDQSNLGNSPDWPILLSNLVELRRDALPGLRRWNYRLEETVQLRLPPRSEDEQGELLLVPPAGRPRQLVRDRSGIVEIPPLNQPGVYRITEGQTEFGKFAVNFFDRDESNLLSLSSGTIVPEEHYEPAKISLDNPFSWLIVLAILLILTSILLDWRVLAQRRSIRVTSA